MTNENDDMGFHANEFVDDMMLAVDDHPFEYADVTGVMDMRIVDDGVGLMTIRTNDGDVINVIIIIQSIG